ncbi:MAG: TIGR03915 family putative DNA repair protein, partial [Clostridiales Family XIII bacterium]|nr:TIGR03915 family putative DNA repair protein [Clostridiales Family XIII bacterium]
RAHDPQSAASAAAREILYAPIEPDNDVVEFLAPHFCDRFKNDPFIIHDKKRGKALVAFGKIRYVADFADESLLRDTEEEKAYRKLWRRYFDAIAIKERTNPKCQRNFMPVRYWKHITEVGERAPLF